MVIASAETFHLIAVSWVPRANVIAKIVGGITGSAFIAGLRFASDEFRIISGAIGSYTEIGSSGSKITRWFCASCESSIYGSSTAHPSTVYMRAGVLDDPGLVKPNLDPGAQMLGGREVGARRFASDLTVGQFSNSLSAGDPIGSPAHSTRRFDRNIQSGLTAIG